MVETNTAVKLEGVSKVYSMGEVQVYALRDVSLTLTRGEFVVILGPSGCGKSTLLNIVGALDTPTSGRVLIDGQDIQNMNESELTRLRRDKIGFVFQFFNLIPTLTAHENVQLAAELVARPRDIDQVLAEVGLRERARHFPSELSGGEQQRVAIARGLVKNPPILLCDEPTGELDFETGRMILALLDRITHELNQTVLLVTHNTAISAIADRVIRLRSGQIVADEFNPNPLSADQLQW
ncbi:MAG: ABC transporter ATP-binding protein [Fimbriimonadia bacterium]|nr:ABC transporter ATP-binding protein [Fimbriimonadia bacterium]